MIILVWLLILWVVTLGLDWGWNPARAIRRIRFAFFLRDSRRSFDALTVEISSFQKNIIRANEALAEFARQYRFRKGEIDQAFTVRTSNEENGYI